MNQSPSPNTLISIGAATVGLGILVCLLANLFFGLAVIGIGIYTASLGLRRFASTLPRCTNCGCILGLNDAYCPLCGAQSPARPPQ